MKIGGETQKTGKRGELTVIGELLKRGFDVYIPVVDTEGIDCIVKTKSGKYIDIQIKTRYERPLFDVNVFHPRDNFFIICYWLKEKDEFWIIPSKVFKENSTLIKKYKRYRLILGETGSKKRKELWMYRNNFDQFEITKEKVEERKVKYYKKSGWERLKEKYPDVKSVEEKIKEAKTKGLSEDYIKVLENLKKYWEKQKKVNNENQNF
jgi:hypothetical protein